VVGNGDVQMHLGGQDDAQAHASYKDVADEGEAAVTNDETFNDKNTPLAPGSSQTKSDNQNKADAGGVALRTAFAIFAGVLFGIALVKSGVHRADVLRG